MNIFLWKKNVIKIRLLMIVTVSGSGSTHCPGEELPSKDGVIYPDIKAKRKCPYDLASCYRRRPGRRTNGKWVKQRTNGVKYGKE